MQPLFPDSSDDPRLADYRSVSDPALAVRRGLFVAEGRLVVRRLLEHTALRVHSVLVTAPAHAALADVFAGRADVPVFVVPPPIMSGIAGFHVHRGCLALGERPALATWPSLAATARRLAILEQVGDAANVGAIVRSAAAFGIDGILLGPGCADPFYRQAIRASMGMALRMTFARAEPWPEMLEPLQADGWTAVAMTPAIDAPPLADTLAGRSGPVAILVGHEGNGLTEPASRLCRVTARIPMAQSVDSLNVAAAAAIAFYEVVRQQPADAEGNTNGRPRIGI